MCVCLTYKYALFSRIYYLFFIFKEKISFIKTYSESHLFKLWHGHCCGFSRIISSCVFIMKKILFLFLLLLFAQNFISGQSNDVPQRTPEHEASRQTERMQVDLNLTQEQVDLIYDINLRYERERLLSDARYDVVERIKKKNEDIKKVLTEEQYKKMQNMRNRFSPSDSPEKKIENKKTLDLQ